VPPGAQDPAILRVVGVEEPVLQPRPAVAARDRTAVGDVGQRGDARLQRDAVPFDARGERLDRRGAVALALVVPQERRVLLEEGRRNGDGPTA
jgi:hypothetical protein